MEWSGMVDELRLDNTALRATGRLGPAIAASTPISPTLATTCPATGSANAAQTAAVEFALGTIGKAFMSAVVKPAMPTLTPLTLSMIARETIARGNAVYRISVNPSTGAPRLNPVSAYEISGGVAPESWMYTTEQERPTGEPLKATVPYDGIVHVRYLPRSSAPWHGIAPLVGAGASAEVLALVERSLKYDVMPQWRVHPAPARRLWSRNGLGANQGRPDSGTWGRQPGRNNGPRFRARDHGGTQRGLGTEAVRSPGPACQHYQLLGEEAAWILDALGVPAGPAWGRWVGPRERTTGISSNQLSCL